VHKIRSGSGSAKQRCPSEHSRSPSDRRSILAGDHDRAITEVASPPPVLLVGEASRVPAGDDRRLLDRALRFNEPSQAHELGVSPGQRSGRRRVSLSYRAFHSRSYTRVSRSSI
jgi:hypothetical protein